MASMQEQLAGHARIIRQLSSAFRNHASEIQVLQQVIADLQSRPRSVSEEIDAIPGRRIESVISGEIDFDINDLGQRGRPIIMSVSMDGPFVQTHYAMALWRPTAPENATNLGRWRPVSSYPLPDQVVDTDIIDIMYELNDGGAGRMFQNEPRSPLLSRPDNVVPTPVPTLWGSNSTIAFVPTYNAITFDGATPPTAGKLHVDMIGYRIVNM